MFPFDALRVIAAAVAVVSPSPTPSAPPEITHVVTADRAESTLRSTTRTTYVVTAADIARRGYRTVGDALADIPGVEINHYGGVGANVSYGIRGSSSAQVVVLMDGLPAAGAFANSVQFGTISTSGVRRIEVVEGGGSTLYGTGAIGGIINIITDSQKTAPSASILYGTFNDAELHAQGDGFSIDRVTSSNGFRTNSDVAITTARFGLDRKIGAIDAAFRASLENDRLGAPGPIAFESLTSRENDTNDGGSLSFSQQRARSRATLQIGGSRQALAFGCDGSGVDPNCYFVSQALSTESRVNLGLRDTISNAGSRVIYGIDLSRGVVRADDGQNTAQSIVYDALAQSAAYAQANWTLRNGDVYVGLRGERDGALGGEFSPSFGLREELRDGVSLKLNVASAFRAPNASELYFPGYGNPHLVPERARVGDAALHFANILGGTTVTWFTNYSHDLIEAVEDPATFAYSPQNVAQALLQGFTFETKTVPFHGVTFGVNATDLYHATDLQTKSRLPNDPVFTVDGILGFDGAKTGVFQDGGLSVRIVGERQFFDPTQPLYAQSGEYATSDAFVRLRVAPRMLLSLHAYNIGNERYGEVSGYPMPGRTFTLQLTTH